MAQSNSSNDNWFGSWISAAKDKIKNSEVLESVRKDLEEFGHTVKKEASSVLSSTGNVIEKTLSLDSPDSTASTVKKSFSTFLDQVNTVLNPTPEDDDAEAIIVTEGSEIMELNKFQLALYNMQNDENTYLTEPEADLAKQYQSWLEVIEEQFSEERLARQLKNSSTLNKRYLELVPDKISAEIFWRRYLFKKALLEDELAREECIEKKKVKEVVKPEKPQLVEENIKWEHEDFAKDIELTEEEQIKLLEEYENETKIRKSRPSSNTEKSENTDNASEKKSSSPNIETTSSSSSIDDEWEKVNDVDK